MSLFETLGKALAPNTKAERLSYMESVINSLKEDQLIPDKVARMIASDYGTDIEWGRLFSRNANQCAARIVGKFKRGESPISLNPTDDDEENDLC